MRPISFATVLTRVRFASQVHPLAPLSRAYTGHVCPPLDDMRANADGVVNFTDLNAVLAAFGTSCQ